MTLPFTSAPVCPKAANRRSFIGGSDARIIMGDDEAALLRLWREKRGEVEPEDLIPDLIDQNPCAHRRNPMDMIFQGRSMSVFQA